VDPVDLISQGKIKRFFRATHKLTHTAIISHITQRAAGKEPVFLEEDDYPTDFGSGQFPAIPEVDLPISGQASFG
jgi:hypothetical protein